MEWLRHINPTQRPLYLAIADALEQAIEMGELRAGDRLAAHRLLAQHLEIDLTTATRAYAEARRRGLLDATVGRGTFVRAPGNRNHRGEDRSYMDMSINLPPQPQDPSLRGLLHDGLSNLIHSSNTAMLMSYRAVGGSLGDREAGALWLQPVLGRIDPDRLLVCAGAQCSLTAIVTLLAKPGSTILTDPLTYPNFSALAAHLGIRLAVAEMDQHGMQPDSVEAACRAEKPQAIYCVPTIQNPTTATMPVERRQALAAIAVRYNVPVLEDDPYGLLPRQLIPAIATFAPEHVYYIGTLSKCLSPGFRLAYVVAPNVSQAQRLAAAVRATSLAPSSLLTSLVTNWILDGSAAALRKGVHRENVERQKIAAEILPAGSVQAHPEGLHLWLTLPHHWNRLEFVTYVRQLGLSLVPSDAFIVTPSGHGTDAPNAVRICLGTASSQIMLRAGLQSIVDTMRMEGSQHLAYVV
jgi:DNA-binding transcriptional MocR family regulator